MCLSQIQTSIIGIILVAATHALLVCMLCSIITTHNNGNRSLYYIILLMMAKVFQLDGVFTESEASEKDKEEKLQFLSRVFSPSFRCKRVSVHVMGGNKRGSEFGENIDRIRNTHVL